MSDDRYVAATAVTFTEDVAARFAAYGWHVDQRRRRQRHGRDRSRVRGAIDETERPSLIVVDTVIGYGAPNKSGTFEAHGSPLGAEETRGRSEISAGRSSRRSGSARGDGAHRRSLERGARAEDAWRRRFDEIRARDAGAAPRSRAASRAAARSLGARAAGVRARREGDGDAQGVRGRAAGAGAHAAGADGRLGRSGSVDVQLAEEAATSSPRRRRRDGAREQWAAAGATPGATSTSACASTRWARRSTGSPTTAASSRSARRSWCSPTTCGPRSGWRRCRGCSRSSCSRTTASASARTGRRTRRSSSSRRCARFPDLLVIRPGDANETRVAWQVAIESRDRPTALVLTRQAVPTLDRARFADAEGLRRGAYVLDREPARRPAPDVILIASGSELSVAVAAADRLRAAAAIRVRVVSMPCWRLFEEQTAAYRDARAAAGGEGAGRGRGGGVARLGSVRRRRGHRRRHRPFRRLGAGRRSCMREYGFTPRTSPTRRARLLGYARLAARFSKWIWSVADINGACAAACSRKGGRRVLHVLGAGLRRSGQRKVPVWAGAASRDGGRSARRLERRHDRRPAVTVGTGGGVAGSVGSNAAEPAAAARAAAAGGGRAAAAPAAAARAVRWRAAGRDQAGAAAGAAGAAGRGGTGGAAGTAVAAERRRGRNGARRAATPPRRPPEHISSTRPRAATRTTARRRRPPGRR